MYIVIVNALPQGSLFMFWPVIIQPAEHGQAFDVEMMRLMWCGVPCRPSPDTLKPRGIHAQHQQH